MQIKTVLCPIDFSTLSDFELSLALEVCETFGARLVLHHNLAAADAGLHKAWEWEMTHHGEMAAGQHKEMTEPAAREHLAKILNGIPPEIRAEARISRGPMGLVLLNLIEDLSADLVLLGSHGWSSDEHTSLSERIIESAPCPVLAIQEGRGDTHALSLHPADGVPATKALVPTDFSDSASQAVAYALELARCSPLEVHLLHVHSGRKAQVVPLDPIAESPARPDGAIELAAQKLEELVPSDLADRVACHVEIGSPAEEIMAEAGKLGAELIVMGEHARSFFRRFFTRDTSRELLHRARCPVWFVPAGYEVS